MEERSLWPSRRIFLLVLIVAFMSCISLAGYVAFERAISPIGTELSPTIFTIEKGSSLNDVALKLKAKKLIRSRLAFVVLAHLTGAERAIKAGKYVLSPSYSSEKILDILVNGLGLRYVITIPEGKNIYEIGRIFEAAGLFSRKAFLSSCEDRSLLHELHIDGPTAEGFLFPDTYYVSYGTVPKEIVRMMVMHFWDVWHKMGFDQKAKARGLSVMEVVTLASIVEKEALLEKERPLIASVFLNRLKKGMKLQADPTVRYGLLVEKGIYPRRLRTRHLRHRSPYNTYVVKGLPKGPVCNPGKESIQAVLEPARSDYLYFVSMNNGSHKFSKTLKEHNRAVYEYQIRHARPPKGQVQ